MLQGYMFASWCALEFQRQSENAMAIMQTKASQDFAAAITFLVLIGWRFMSTTFNSKWDAKIFLYGEL
jgi:hypothetical protein